VRNYENEETARSNEGFYNRLLTHLTKALKTKTDEDLIALRNSIVDTLAKNEAANNQLKYDLLKNNGSVEADDFDNILLIKSFNTKRLTIVEEEILARSLRDKDLTIILEEQTETGRYFMRKKDVEEAFANNSVEDVSEDGKTFTIRGKLYINLYSDPEQAINRNEKGEIVSVSLTNDSNQTITFSTERIVDEIAFAILSSKMIQENEQVITEPVVNQQIIDAQNKETQEKKQKELLQDLLDVQELQYLISFELDNQRKEFKEAGFKAKEINAYLKTTDKYSQLEELKKIEKSIKSKLKEKPALIITKKKKSIKPKVQKNEITTTPGETASKSTATVTGQILSLIHI
jgi:hypothetical protein